MNSRQKALRVERLLGIFALVSILIAWIVGANLANGDLQPHLQAAALTAGRFDQLDGNTYAAWSRTDPSQLIGYVAVNSAQGYGGPLTLAVAVDETGIVTGISIVDHKETPSYLSRVLREGGIEKLLGLSHQDRFVVGQDVDAISGATYTTQALAESVRASSYQVAETELGLPVLEPEIPKINFGIPEISLIALYAAGFFGHQRNFKYKKAARWASMLAGLIVLGFIYNRPLTLSHINQFLLGYWPQLQTNLYWYLLLGGILFVFTVDNKNPYCDWFCPFGAAQECMGAVGRAKTRSVGRFRDPLKWLIRTVTWAAIVIALLMRNPGITSYEIFGTLFNFTGSTVQFILLGIILVAALFIRKPWCAYLCPLGPVTDLYRTFRKWVIEQWQKRKAKSAALTKS